MCYQFKFVENRKKKKRIVWYLNAIENVTASQLQHYIIFLRGAAEFKSLFCSCINVTSFLLPHQQTGFFGFLSHFDNLYRFCNYHKGSFPKSHALAIQEAKEIWWRIVVFNFSRMENPGTIVQSGIVPPLCARGADNLSHSFSECRGSLWFRYVLPFRHSCDKLNIWNHVGTCDTPDSFTLRQLPCRLRIR